MVRDLWLLVENRFRHFGFTLIHCHNGQYGVIFDGSRYGYITLSDKCIIFKMSGYFNSCFIDYNDFDVDVLIGLFLCRINYNDHHIYHWKE